MLDPFDGAAALAGGALGIALALLWRRRQWRRYRATLDPETEWKRAWYAHCAAQPRSCVTTAPGLRLRSRHEEP